MSKKPTLRKGPASHHEAPNEVIREFGDGKGNGGLLSLRILDSGQLIVEAYAVSGPVTILAPQQLGSATVFDPAEMDYLARSVDLGRSDTEASAILSPTQRDDLLRKLGGRRN